jgi:hypothetical protein
MIYSHCSICLDLLLVIQNYKSCEICNAYFHTRCIDSWTLQKNNCPNCRSIFVKNTIIISKKSDKSKKNNKMNHQDYNSRYDSAVALSFIVFCNLLFYKESNAFYKEYKGHHDIVKLMIICLLLNFLIVLNLFLIHIGRIEIISVMFTTFIFINLFH